MPIWLTSIAFSIGIAFILHAISLAAWSVLHASQTVAKVANEKTRFFSALWIVFALTLCCPLVACLLSFVLHACMQVMRVIADGVRHDVCGMHGPVQRVHVGVVCRARVVCACGVRVCVLTCACVHACHQVDLLAEVGACQTSAKPPNGKCALWGAP